MLKHVHFSSSSLVPYRCKTPTRDNVSLSSALSFGSSVGPELMSSWSSSTSSLQEMSSPTEPPKVMLKIYTRVLCADMEYKTLCITRDTTSKEVVRVLLNKFRMKHRDPNLFYLTMEVWMRKTGIPIRSLMVLDDESRPAELQACHPIGETKQRISLRPLCRFILQMRRGGLVKIYDGCLMAESLYKSLLVSDRTTVEELIQLILHCYNSKERPNLFSLYEVCTSKHYERKLHPNDYPIFIQNAWPDPKHFAFHLRKDMIGYQKRKESLESQSSLCFRLYV
ncbi:uncharacterized protein LOC106468895 isoform X1 [Limulus polyphemus]|uniref:Uncharacterized protein LOC106468895 isoform X1 n=1 Tax=Limulus polyphemus TaxID=6850 RepID=A0ABM1TD31_LIMPO|nr:uncharacterized protein LOC106468895 isoform X1 [Limulus polyphemus]